MRWEKKWINVSLLLMDFTKFAKLWRKGERTKKWRKKKCDRNWHGKVWDAVESFLFGNNLDCVPIIGFLFVNLFTRTRQKSPDEKAFALAPSPFYLFLHFPLLIKSQWELNLIAGSILGAIACVYRVHIYVTFLLLLFIHFKLCFPFHFCPTCFWFFFWQFTDVSHNFPWGWHSFFFVFAVK